MSTIFKSAAMSLLSKTLQTFLSKYLSDVDVQGVALPTLTGGWGVQLSNVQLRNGVELVSQMPGTVKRKRTRKKKKISQKKMMRKHKEQTEEEEEAEQGTRRRRRKQHPTATATTSQGGGRRHQEEIIATTTTASRSRTHSLEELDVSLSQLVDDDEAADPAPPPPPSSSSIPSTTPMQDTTTTTTKSSTSSTLFSCFAKGRNKLSSTTDDDDAEDTLPYYTEEEEAEENKETPLIVRTTKTQVSSSRSSGLAIMEEDDFPMKEENEKELAAYSVQRQGMTEQDTIEKEEESEEDDDDDDNDFELGDDDEEETYAQAYRLCVGDNGRIGTLDIRLVDKELHVLVEDALLTIECFPVAEDTANASKEDTPGMDETTQSTGTGTGVPPPPTAIPPVKAKVKKAEPKRDTVGDRVLADNPLARAIAAIPHLFLRDVRIRLILRKEAPSTATTTTAESQTDSPTSPNIDSNKAGAEDTMLEIGIEFLSVSNGEDALSVFQQPQEEQASATEEDVPSKVPMTLSMSTSSLGQVIDNNEYMVRHIRTGRGSDAGISVQVFAPTPKLPKRISLSTSPSWARQRWMQATNFHLLRCSGLDIRARIHLGTKKQISSYSWFFEYDEEYGEYDYDDGDIDSMLVGFDNVAPGMQALPPMYPTMSRGDTPIKPPPPLLEDGEESEDAPPAMHPGSEKFTLDDNDIQSCKIPTTFHRISRGLRPGTCKDCQHLPSDTCELCWEGSATIPRIANLDSSMPLPGLALQITLRDPLEINVDKPSVDTLHLLKTLFVKPKEKMISENDEKETTQRPEESTGVMKRLDSTTSIATTKSTSSGFFSYFTSRKVEAEKEKDPLESFSPLMQPENIQVLGVHLAHVALRFHVLREDQADDGLAFSYWDMVAACLTMDHQTLRSKELTSQDLRFDVGYFSWKEFCGVNQRVFASLGVPTKSKELSSVVSTSKSLGDDHLLNKTPWPSAACALMDIPPPQETLLYKDRKGHGVQLRLISAQAPNAEKEPLRTLINARLGPTILNAPWGFWSDIISVKNQITSGILGKPDQAPAAAATVTPKPTKPLPSALMTYTFQIDSGSIVLPPMINMRFPLSRVSGERSSESGIFLSTVLGDLEVAYGRKAPSSTCQQGLTIHQLAALPESIRTRILFCIDDWSNLEEALEINKKKEANPFKRTMAIQKAILKTSKARLSQAVKAATKRPPKVPSLTSSTASRAEILGSLTQLSDDELQHLWSLRQQGDTVAN